MKPDEFDTEEYKRISSWSKEYDKQIVQLFGVTVVVCASLISALSAILFKDNGKLTVEASHALLAPVLVLVPAFRYMLSQRQEIVRMAAFVYVFYEVPLGRVGWEGALQRLRARNSVPGESNDKVTWTIWVIMFISLSLFFLAVSQALCKQTWWPAVPGIIIWGIAAALVFSIQKQWIAVIPIDYPKYIEEFNQVKTEIDRTQPSSPPERS